MPAVARLQYAINEPGPMRSQCDHHSLQRRLIRDSLLQDSGQHVGSLLPVEHLVLRMQEHAPTLMCMQIDPVVERHCGRLIGRERWWLPGVNNPTGALA